MEMTMAASCGSTLPASPHAPFSSNSSDVSPTLRRLPPRRSTTGRSSSYVARRLATAASLNRQCKMRSSKSEFPRMSKVEKPHVLLADDNEATCTLLTALLQREFEVAIATDGNEAIERLRTRRYAALLLD